MKKILFVMVAMFTMLACNTGKEQPKEQTTDTIQVDSCGITSAYADSIDSIR